MVLEDVRSDKEKRQKILERDEIEKCLRRFDASLQWLTERMGQRDGEMEMDNINRNYEIEENEKYQVLRAWIVKSIADVLEEVEELVDTHFFNEFSETKSAGFLKYVLSNQAANDMRLFKKTWTTLNCSPKTMKVMREIQENLLCVGKWKGLIQRKGRDDLLGQKGGLVLNSKHIISCCKKACGEITARNDTVVNVLLNNILVQRGLTTNE